MGEASVKCKVRPKVIHVYLWGHNISIMVVNDIKGAKVINYLARGSEQP